MGKYLIKLLDKISEREELKVVPHGTVVRLMIRPAAKLDDILSITRSWIIFPRCNVTVIVDDAEPVTIGYTSPREAIEAYLRLSVGTGAWFARDVEVREASGEGVTRAFAVAKSEYFREWEFLEIVDSKKLEQISSLVPIATCVEGIAVEFQAPGFAESKIIAISDTRGPSAPKTNVARSALEDTTEYANYLSVIYNLYADQISGEIDRLTRHEGYSLSGAINDVPFLAGPLLGSRAKPTKPDLLTDALGNIPLLVVEESSRRTPLSVNALVKELGFWTVESTLSRSIETFIRAAPAEITAGTLLGTLGNSASPYPTGPIVCNYPSSKHLDDAVKTRFEICEVSVVESLRSVNLKWAGRIGKSRWLRASNIIETLLLSDRKVFDSINREVTLDGLEVNIDGHVRFVSSGGFNKDRYNYNIATQQVTFAGLTSSFGFISAGENYLRGDVGIGKFFTSIWDEQDINIIRSLFAYFIIVERFFQPGKLDLVNPRDSVARITESKFVSATSNYLVEYDRFVLALRETPPRLMDIYVNRKQPN
jgi:molecular chaperone HtpG